MSHSTTAKSKSMAAINFALVILLTNSYSAASAEIY